MIAQLLSLYRDGHLLRQAIAEAARRSEADQPSLEARRRALAAEARKTERALARYYGAFEAGQLESGRFAERVSGLEERLQTLGEEDASLAAELASNEAAGPGKAELAAVAAQLERVLASGAPEKAKALLRLLIKELRVNGRSEILPTYRVLPPEVCATPSSVGAAGIEPATSRV